MALTPALQGLVVSSLLFGSILVAPFAGLLSDRFGARRLIATAGVLSFAGSLGAALATNPATLIAFRFVLGLGVGIGSVQVPMYLAELSPVSVRGRLTSLFQLMIAIGIFLAYLCGFLFAGAGNWRMMFGIGTLPAITLTLGVLLLPNSPRWLAKRGRMEEARAVLRATRPAGEADREFVEMTSLIERVNLSI
jgi:MFS family permease